MSRFIRELTTNIAVWKYVFMDQPSEQSRLHKQFGLGTYSVSDEFHDLLVLDRDGDLPRLHDMAERFRPDLENFYRETNSFWVKSDDDGVWRLVAGSPEEELYYQVLRRFPDIHFKGMVVTMSDFAKRHPELEQLRLEGEF